MVEQPIRILQVSTADLQGGAERVAWNLFTAYRRRGHNSRLAVGVKRSDDPDVRLIPNEAWRGRWYHFFRNISCRWQERATGAETAFSRFTGILAEPARRLDYYRGIEDFHFPGTSRLLALNGKRPDILHAHNLHGAYFDLRRLPWLSRQIPVMLTLHDAWLLSGHCAHSFACDRWKTGCGRCPDLSIYPAIERDATAYNWRRKRDIFARCRLYVATPSQWLMRKVEESMLAPAIVEPRVVPNGVDLSIFHPAGRQEVRAQLGIPQDTRVLLAAGVKIRDSIWKDFRTLKQAVALVSRRLQEQELLLIVLGEDAPPQRYGRAEIRFIPFQQDIATVASYYQAADVYIHVARADTFPTAILEAMACGIPVVATAVGGIPEQVDEARTGFLVPAGDETALAARIEQVLTDPHLKRDMKRRAVEKARQRYGLNRQVDTYLDWYVEMLERKRASTSPSEIRKAAL